MQHALLALPVAWPSHHRFLSSMQIKNSCCSPGEAENTYASSRQPESLHRGLAGILPLRYVRAAQATKTSAKIQTLCTFSCTVRSLSPCCYSRTWQIFANPGLDQED